MGPRLQVGQAIRAGLARLQPACRFVQDLSPTSRGSLKYKNGMIAVVSSQAVPRAFNENRGSHGQPVSLQLLLQGLLCQTVIGVAPILTKSINDLTSFLPTASPRQHRSRTDPARARPYG